MQAKTRRRASTLVITIDGVTVTAGNTISISALPVYARRFRSRSGRTLFGDRYAGVWTSKADDKLERRRIRSRLLALAREEESLTNGTWVVTSGGSATGFVLKGPGA